MTALAVVAAVAVLGAGLLWRRRCLALVAQASHELRGPLQSALLGLHGLSDEVRVAAIDLELRRAVLALEDLSAAARGRRAAGSVGEVDVGALLREAAAAWAPLARERGVPLLVEPPAAPVVVHADRLRLAQALANLVANALEHGAGPVRVRARAAADGRARVEVTDGGPGLPAPLGTLLASARGRRTRRGHGLALAAAIARRHGGRLATAPSPSGARLVLELPVAAPGARSGGGRRLARLLRRDPPVAFIGLRGAAPSRRGAPARRAR